MPARPRILFIDEEPRVLAGLRRALHGCSDTWEMTFAEQPEQALASFDQAPYDVIVADLGFPGAGDDLLRAVMSRYPNTVRIVLSAESQREAMLRAVGPMHQYLAKPCDPDTLKDTLARACALSSLLASERLRRLVTRMETLPSLPNLYLEIVDELHASDPSAKRVGEIIAQDMGMSARVLQVVNSAFYALRQEVSSPVHAVVLLGLESIRVLVLSLHVFEQFERFPLRGLSLKALWRHSVLVATTAKRAAEWMTSDPKIADHAFMTGLLHDVGKLVLRVNLPREYARALDRAESARLCLHEAEQELFGATHAEVGAYLLGIWGLPDAIVMATARHHNPSVSPSHEFGPLAAVHVCDALVREVVRAGARGVAPEMDGEYLSNLGLLPVLPRWRALVRDTVTQMPLI